MAGVWRFGFRLDLGFDVSTVYAITTTQDRGYALASSKGYTQNWPVFVYFQKTIERLAVRNCFDATNMLGD